MCVCALECDRAIEDDDLLTRFRSSTTTKRLNVTQQNVYSTLIEGSTGLNIRGDYFCVISEKHVVTKYLDEGYP